MPLILTVCLRRLLFVFVHIFDLVFVVFDLLIKSCYLLPFFVMYNSIENYVLELSRTNNIETY